MAERSKIQPPADVPGIWGTVGMNRIAIATLLAGLSTTPAWAQDAVTVGNIQIWDNSPPKTNLDNAWMLCEGEGGSSTGPSSVPSWGYKWTWPTPFQTPCSTIQTLITTRDKEAKEKHAAEMAKLRAAADKAALATIRRGLSDPDGKPK